MAETTADQVAAALAGTPQAAIDAPLILETARLLHTEISHALDSGRSIECNRLATLVLEAAAPLIRAAERERQRSLLPYIVPCCDHFTDAVADLINEHEDT